MRQPISLWKLFASTRRKKLCQEFQIGIQIMLDVISVSIIIMYRLEWAERARTSHALLCEHIKHFIFLEWFWNFCSANIFHCISFSFYYFKIHLIAYNSRCWNLRLSDRDLGYRAGNFQTRKHFICSIRLSKKSFVGFHMARTKCDRKPCKRDKSTSRDFVARGRPLRGQKRLAPLAKRSTCSKSTVPSMIEEDC